MTSRIVSRLRAVALRAALAATAGALLIGTAGVQGAQADPDAVAKARAQVDQLTTEAAAIDQDYAAVQDKLASARRKLAAAKSDVAAQQRKVDSMRAAAGRIALAQYQGRDVDPTTRLIFADDPGSLMNRYATVQQVTENQNSALQDFQLQQANLTDMQRDAETQKAAIAEDEKGLQALRTRSDAKVAQAQKVLDRLSKEERERLAEQEAKEQREAEERANAATSRSEERTDTSADKAEEKSDSEDAAESAPAGSGSGAAALAWAKKQAGKPYIYGGTGPSGYDCSGLTGAAWKAAGVSLPRTSQAQFGAGKAVSKGDLQPGDLVFYYGGISHVALYAGNGMIFHASRPGKPIGYAKLDSMPYAGARRPG